MRKVFLVLFCLLLSLLFVESVLAAPFVYCDPFPATLQVDGFKIRIDGGAWIDVPPAVDGSGGKYIKFDLAPLNLATGNHTGEVLAYNIWGDGEVTPFSFSKGVPSPPASIRLLKQ